LYFDNFVYLNREFIHWCITTTCNCWGIVKSNCM